MALIHHQGTGSVLICSPNYELLGAFPPNTNMPLKKLRTSIYQYKYIYEWDKLVTEFFLSLSLVIAVPRLIELCRSPTERNNSDSVLVACLVGAKCVCLNTRVCARALTLRYV